MKSILVTMIISLLLLKPNGGEPEPVEDYSGFTYRGQEYKLEDLGFLPGSQIIPVRGWYINGYHIIPKEIKHRGAVLAFGGSEGSCALSNALVIAYHGYEVYAMHFFGKDNQKKRAEQIPLEFFAELYLYIQRTAQSPKPLTIHGTSMGTELALLLAGTFPEQVDHLILYAPSAYVFQSSRGRQHSRWTFQGKELPYISTEGSEELRTKDLIAIRDHKLRRGVDFYRYGIEHDQNREKARINLAPVRAKMLLFAGELDEAWPSADMAREIKANYDGECELVIFEKAGHAFSRITTFDGTWAGGGEPEANVQAYDESYRIQFEKLEEWTK